MQKEAECCCGQGRDSQPCSCETNELATLVDMDAGYASSVSCAGLQDTLESHGWERGSGTPRTDSCAGSHACSPSPSLGVSVNTSPLSLDSTDNSEHAVALEQRQMDISVSTSSWSERNGVHSSEEVQTEQLHASDIPCGGSEGFADTLLIGSPQSPGASRQRWNEDITKPRPLSGLGMKSWRKSQSTDDSSMNSPPIERGYVPPPPSHAKFPGWGLAENEGTSVDEDLDERTERSRHSSPSTMESSDDDDSQSKSSEEDIYLLRPAEPDVPVCVNVTSQSDSRPYPALICEQWKKKSHSTSPIGRMKASTLSRTDGRSSLRNSSYFPQIEYETLELPMGSRIQRVQSCDTLAMIDNQPVGSVLRTKSMDMLDMNSDQQSDSIQAAKKQPGNHLRPPLQKRPSIATSLMSSPQTSSRHSPKSRRSRSPLPIASRLRMSFRKSGREQASPETPTPTVIPNPCLSSTFFPVDNPDNSCSDDFVSLDDRERSRSPSAQSLLDDSRKTSFDSVFSLSGTPTPLVHVTGPGQGVHRRDVLYSLPSCLPDREFGDRNELHNRRVSDPVVRPQPVSQIVKRSQKLNQEMTSLIVANHEDFSLCLLDCDESLKRRQRTPHRLCQFATKGWVEVLETGLTSSMQLAKMQQSDQKLHCHIWEICRTECENFCRLLAIRDVYMETMRELKGKGHLETVSTEQLFGNLTEVCAVSERWAELFLSLFEGKSADTAGDILGLLQIFSQFDPAVTGPYSRYSQNYARVTHLNLLSEWQADPNFVKCLKWCQQRSDRMSLDQLLIAPVKRFSDYLLLLKDVLKRCPSKYMSELKERVRNVERSVADLNKDVKNNEVYDVVAELQHSLQWPTVSEIDRTGIFVPPGLEHLLEQKSCLNFLANGDRKIVYSKALSLRDSSGRMDIFLFLFDDLLLMTKFNSKGRPRSYGSRGFSRLGHGTYTVYKQPLPLDRVQVYDVLNSSGMENTFTVVHHSRFLQAIGAYTFQATSETEKNTWIAKIAEAQLSWQAQLQLHL